MHATFRLLALFRSQRDYFNGILPAVTDLQHNSQNAMVQMGPKQPDPTESSERWSLSLAYDALQDKKDKVTQKHPCKKFLEYSINEIDMLYN